MAHRQLPHCLPQSPVDRSSLSGVMAAGIRPLVSAANVIGMLPIQLSMFLKGIPYPFRPLLDFFLENRTLFL